jgi:hypothetical protein
VQDSSGGFSLALPFTLSFPFPFAMKLLSGFARYPLALTLAIPFSFSFPLSFSFPITFALTTITITLTYP